MIERFVITEGATTTANGKVTAASSDRWINDARVALEGDPVDCPACHSAGVIRLDGPRLSDTVDGKEVALSNDLCICKCSPPPRLVASQSFVCQTIDAD